MLATHFCARASHVDRPGASASRGVQTDCCISHCIARSPRQSNMFSKITSSIISSSSFLRVQLTECLEALAHACPVDATEALETLSIYMDNIIQMPLEKKFRAIRISNVNFQERIGHLNGTCGARRLVSLVAPRRRGLFHSLTIILASLNITALVRSLSRGDWLRDARRLPQARRTHVRE